VPRGVRQAIQISREAFLLGAWRNKIGAHGQKRNIKEVADADLLCCRYSVYNTVVLGATTKTNDYGEYLSVRCWCAHPSRYSPDSRALKLLSPETLDEITDTDRWLFLDTETTGLAGGSGTYAFLVGIAWWDGGGLEIEQFFMREYSEERSLLFALRERMAERPVLVTFNGKSFDWPLLETRYRMSRKISVPTPRAHLDFLHPARNLWRLRLGSVRLSELERHVLGWDRGADLLSGLIPQIYFDYLREGPPERLLPVLLVVTFSGCRPVCEGWFFGRPSITPTLRLIKAPW
jgi:uncharacterized protein YprB with RNaseH-like and TPR domain